MNTQGFRKVPRTGVIYVMEEARKVGYTPGDPTWANLGQGSPETGEIEGWSVPDRQIVLDQTNRHYSPVAGTLELRKKIAEMYNELYRKNKKSKYTYKNVSVCNGGRLALTRLAASLGNVHIGHIIPDYTAYEELLTLFKSFIPIPIHAGPENGFTIPIDELKKEIQEKGLQALLLSNPSNPTGRLLHGKELSDWVGVARSEECTMIFDEFYSHYIYTDLPKRQYSVSAANFVNDVNNDSVVILDGFTKNWRLPGLRLGWIVGPEDVIESVNSAGSFIDGGPNHPSQQYALSLLDIEQIKQRSQALQKHFKAKRDFVLESLKEMGLESIYTPEGTFYVWVDVSSLPEPLNTGMGFFRECLKRKVVTVPGEFFDVNPGKRRKQGKYVSYVRLSYGPSLDVLKRGVDTIRRILKQKTPLNQ